MISSVKALKERDFESANQIFNADAKVNQKRFDLQSLVVTIIATQQPMAHDLRVLASIFEIASELERIGDYAKGIALLTIRIGSQPLVKSLIDLPLMAELATDMLRRALDAFMAEDLEAVSSPLHRCSDVRGGGDPSRRRGRGRSRHLGSPRGRTGS